jgi:hypothetical protein
MLLVGEAKSPPPKGGGGFADYAVVSLHCLRVYLKKSYREALDLLSEMPHILGEIGLEPADLPHHSTLVKRFDKIKTALWRVLLRLSAFTRAKLLCAHKIAKRSWDAAARPEWSRRNRRDVFRSRKR